MVSNVSKSTIQSTY